MVIDNSWLVFTTRLTVYLQKLFLEESVFVAIVWQRWLDKVLAGQPLNIAVVWEGLVVQKQYA